MVVSSFDRQLKACVEKGKGQSAFFGLWKYTRFIFIFLISMRISKFLSFRLAVIYVLVFRLNLCGLYLMRFRLSI
jgi:hypothetical protein